MPTSAPEPESGEAQALATPAIAQVAGVPVSFTAISPAQQGDVFSGLTLAIAGVGPDGIEHLPIGATRPQVGPADAWAAPVVSETGQYVLLSQDCDLVREPAAEPTVQIAPLVLIDEAHWQDLNRNGYSARRYAYPSVKFSGVPDGKGLAVDLAWTTSILKGSLAAPGVTASRPLTGPAQRAFTEWVAARTGRVPYADAVVTNVLDPCYDVRKRLLSAFNKAAGPINARIEARVVAAVDRWYAHVDGRLVTILGSVSGPRLQAAGFVDPSTGLVLKEDLASGTTKLQNQVINAMNRVNPDSGYTLKIHCVDLAKMRADRFAQFSLLMR